MGPGGGGSRKLRADSRRQRAAQRRAISTWLDLVLNLQLPAQHSTAPTTPLPALPHLRAAVDEGLEREAIHLHVHIPAGLRRDSEGECGEY